MTPYLLAVAAVVALATAGLARELRFWNASPHGHRQACHKISIIVPLRGRPPGLEDNLKAIAAQRTQAHVELIFVVDTPHDPAAAPAAKLGRLVVSGGQGKGVALAAGLRHAAGDCVVFADDDIRPGPHWLQGLTAPLSQHHAATTYRWYVGEGLCAKARLAISNMGFPAMLDPRSRFVWGGSTALRKEAAEKLHIAERLPHYISDDYAIYTALKEAGASIWFARESIAPTPDPDCRWLPMFRWAVRQILMVKWHAPKGWWIGLTMYTLGFLLSVAAPIAGIALGRPELLAGLALHPINLAKDLIRARGVARHAHIHIPTAHVLAAWALGNLAIPMAVWASAFTKCVEWRGRQICRRTPRTASHTSSTEAPARTS